VLGASSIGVWDDFPPLLKTPQESIPIEKKIKRMEDKRDKTYLKKNSKNKLIKGYEKLNEKKGIND
jgi:hypothetical protein